MRPQRLVDTLAVTLLAIALFSGCGTSHSMGTQPFPAGPGATSTLRSAQLVPATGGDIVAINAGGTTAGNFVADADFVSRGTWTSKAAATIDTSGITNPAPQAVYQSARVGPTVSYTIPGLTPGAVYTVRLSFAELWWTSANQRIFNVAINNVNVQANFDIFAVAGARYKAVVTSYTATASSTGAIAIALTAVKDNADINGIEIAANGGPSPTPPPGAVAINSGGAAAGPFVADQDFVAGGTWTYKTTSSVDTSGVTAPAPQAVYQSEREGQTITYTIPGLSKGATYTVRLDFAELYWTAVNKRVFNVRLNTATVLSNFDIFATAGARYKAVAESFTATATSSGTISVGLTASINNATINGIEVFTGGVPPTPPPNVFNDYATYGYDNQHDVFNPNSTAISPASLPNLHLAWQSNIGDFSTQTQPILATEIPGHTGVLFVGGGSGKVYGYDALSGKVLWTQSLGQESDTLCGPGTQVYGIAGSVAYDAASKSLYVVGNSNPAPNAYANNELFHLDAASGTILGKVNVAPATAGLSELNFSHTSVTISNGVAYVGTGSSCDLSDWRGRVVAVNVPSMTIANTFFTLWDPQNLRGAGPQPWPGGGIWGWGGVSIDFNGNVLTGVGNGDNGEPNGTIQPPFVAAPQEYSGYAETLLELSPDISTVLANNHPIPINSYNRQSNDLDVQGTPLVLRPAGAGCDTMIALQGKSGQLSIYSESRLSNGAVANYQLSPSTWSDGYLGDPAYSPVTNLIYAPVASSVAPTLFAPGLIAVNPGCGTPSVTWHAGFGVDSTGPGIPRAVPAVSAGGVIFAGTVAGNAGDVWAVDASTGTVLNAGNPFFHTSANLRMPPTIDGDWVFIIDNSGNMYGLTVDPNFPAIRPQLRAVDPRSLQTWRSMRRR